jgi:hypothetical protein
MPISNRDKRAMRQDVQQFKRGWSSDSDEPDDDSSDEVFDEHDYEQDQQGYRGD